MITKPDPPILYEDGSARNEEKCALKWEPQEGYFDGGSTVTAYRVF